MICIIFAFILGLVQSYLVQVYVTKLAMGQIEDYLRRKTIFDKNKPADVLFKIN